MRARAIDDEIERTFRAAVACDQARRARVLDLHDLETQHQLGAGRGHTVVERLEQSRAMKSEALRVFAEFRVAQIHHGATARGASVEAMHRRAPLLGGIENAEPIQRELSGWLEKKSRADRPGFREALEHGDVVTVARKRDSRRLAGDAATDDADAQTNPPERAPALICG